MGVTAQTLEYLKLLRAGGILQRYQDQILIRHDNLQVPLREDDFKRLYVPGLIERVSFDTLEEYQLTSDGHRTVAEQSEGQDLGSILADVTGACIVTTAKVTDDTGNDIPYFLITDLGDLTPRQLLDLADRMNGLFADTPQAQALQLAPGGGAIAPLATGLPAPHLYAARDELPAGNLQELLGGALYINRNGLDLIGILEDGRTAITSLTIDQLRKALTTASSD